MSIHSTRSRGRHPNATKAIREDFLVGHVVFEVCDHPDNGVTFGLRAMVDELAPKKKTLFAAHVPPGMATQLRKLAHRLDELAPKLTGSDEDE